MTTVLIHVANKTGSTFGMDNVVFLIVRLPLEFLPVSGPLTQWFASTLGATLLCSSRVGSWFFFEVECFLFGPFRDITCISLWHILLIWWSLYKQLDEDYCTYCHSPWDWWRIRWSNNYKNKYKKQDLF